MNINTAVGRISKKSFKLWPQMLLLAVVFLIYSNVYDNSFLFDDEFLIQKNNFLRSWRHLLDIFSNPSTAGSGGYDSFYRPMQGLAYLVIFQIFGLSTFGFHFLNIVIHSANAILVFTLGQKLNFRKGASLLAALIWAAHPLHTEAVTYQSATADTLYTFFILLGLLSLIPRFNGRKMWLACGFFALALLSKESAVVFPLLVMSVIFLQRENPWNWRNYTITWPYWIMALIYVILRKTILNFDDSFNFYKVANIYTENIHYRIYTFLATLPHYAELIVFPTNLRMERAFPVYIEIGDWAVIVGALIVMIFLLQLVLARGKKGKAWSWAGLWFFSAQIPHMGILIPVNSFFLEHWMYLPSIGLFLGFFHAVAEIKWLKNYQWVMTGFILLAVAALGCKTYRQNEIWSTPIRFYNHILSYGAGTERVHNNLAMAYSDQGALAKAAEHYLKSIEMSGDHSPPPHHNLALVLLRLNQVDLAIAHFKRAIEIDPKFHYSYLALADVYQKLGNQEESKKYMDRYKELTKNMNF